MGAGAYDFQVPCERLEAVAAHIRQKGVEVYGLSHYEWLKATSYYFSDLDRNLLQFWLPDPI